VEEHPARDGDEREGERHHDEGVEEERERCREPPGHCWVGDHLLELHREQRVRSAHLGLGAVGADQHAEGAQLSVDQLAHLVGGDAAAEGGTDGLGQLVVRPPAVDLLQHDVQQAGELDGLTVGAPDECRRLLVAGAGELADQLHAGSPHGHLR
jgi:hypothetical protein